MKRAFVLLTLGCLGSAGAAHAQPAATPAQPAPAATPAPALAPEQVPAASEVSPATADQIEIEGLDVQPGGLTSDETARRALAASSEVMQKHAQLEEANAKIAQTLYQFFPQLTLRASYTRFSPVSAQFGSGGIVATQNAGPLHVGACPNNMPGQCVVDSGDKPAISAAFNIRYLPNNYAVGASMVIPLSDYALRLANASDSAKASQRAAQYAEEATKLRVQTDARVLYLNWLRAHGQVSIAKKALDRNRARLEDVRVAVSVGTATNADSLRLEALVANSEQTVQQAESFRDLVEAELVIIMSDVGATAPYRVGESVPAVDLPVLDRNGVHKAAMAALQRRLEVKAIDATQTALDSGESAVRVGVWPRLDAVGDLTYANPNQRYFPPQQQWNATWSLGVVATWNYADVFLNGARGDEIAAQAAGARAQRIGITAVIAQEVVAAELDVGKAQTALKTSEVATRAAEEAYRVTTDLFRVGRATTTDLIGSETELLGAKLDNTNARIDLAIAALRLRHATGEDIASR
jgi:outer membrane protein